MIKNTESSGPDLMLRVREGDESAFREIVAQFQDDVIGLCTRYIGNQVDAEEVAQEVFIRLYQSRESYESKGKLSTYLYRIAVNQSLNYIRNKKRRKWFSLDSVRSDPSRSGQDDPETAFEKKEREAAIRQVVDALPKNQRTALILRRYQELSYEEIAEVMRCSVSAVEASLHRARQTLRKKLKSFL